MCRAARNLFVVLIAAAGWTAAGGHSRAQETEPADPPRSPAAAPEKKSAPAKSPLTLPDWFPLEWQYLKGPDGKPVPVPARMTLADFFKWQALRRDLAPEPWSLTGISFEGTADDENVTLTARIEVRVEVTDEWVTVPLQMPEALLLAPTAHEGAGEAMPVQSNAERGYSISLNGKGNHKLTMSLLVPARKLALQRRVQLSLPPAAVSSLKLLVRDAKVQARVPERSVLRQKDTGAGTELEVLGLQNRLDLSWQPLPEKSNTDTPLEVNTSVLATLVDGESLTLEANQQVAALGRQGTFDQIRVTLPTGFVLVHGPEDHEYRADPDHPGQIVVKLKKPTSGPVDLRWTVRGDLPPVGQTFLLEGFDVDRAKYLAGHLAVVVVGDFAVLQQPGEDAFVQRANPGDLPPALRQAPSSSTYRFLTRLRLKLKLQRLDPLITVEPVLFLHLTDKAAELEGIFRFQVRGGSASDLTLRWSGKSSQGWIVDTLEPSDATKLRVSDDPDNADLMHIEFAEKVKGAIELRLRAHRDLDAAGPLELALPQGAAPGPAPTWLTILPADNLDVELTDGNERVVRVAADSAPRAAVPREWQSLRRMAYRIDLPETRLSAALRVHSREIRTATEAEASVRNGIVTVRQKIIYDVGYERLGQIRLSATFPAATSGVRLNSPAGARLQSAGAGSDDARNDLRVLLEQPAIGRIEVELQYALEEPANGSGSDELLTVPLVQSRDAPFGYSRFAWRDPSGREATIKGDRWSRSLAPDGTPVWSATEAVASVDVAVSTSGHAAGGAPVSKALIRTVLAGDGAILTRAQYRLAAGIGEAPVMIPSGAQLTGCWWNRRRIEPGPARADAGGNRHYSIVAPERAAAGEPLLTIDLLTRTSAIPHVGGRHALLAPVLRDDWRAAYTMWEVRLPARQHLFLEPDGFAPEYHWRQSGVFFVRECELGEGELRAWIDSPFGDADQPGEGNGNRYLFRTFSGTPTLTFAALNSWVIFLIGAGTALAAGLVLVKWPRTRHFLSLLAAAFCVSAAAVWFAAPVLVLLQPALGGLVLAIVAAAIDAFARRRARPTAVTLTSPSGFMTPPSSHLRGAVVGVGSNEFTSIRPIATEPVQPLSESGSRT